MFTIEQAGTIKKVNTIDELIIEYIKKYSCTHLCPGTNGSCQCNNGNNLGSSLNTEELKELLKPYAKTTDLFDYLKTEEFNKELLKYASSEEIENAVNTLRDYVVNNFALSTDIPEIPTDLVNESALTTALEPYAKLTNLSEYAKAQDLQSYVKKEDILSTENITQELSIATKFVNGTTNDEDKRTYITNLDGDLCNILKKSSLFVKGSCNNEDISGEYLYDSEDMEYYHYKKGENTFSIYFFYYGGTFRYNGNYVVDLESVGYSYKLEVYDECCIPNMNFVKDNYALKSELTNNNIEILKDETIYNDDNEIFWNNLQEAVNDNNVLSSQLAINYIWKSTLDMMIEAAVLKDETTRCDLFDIEKYETLTFNDIEKEKDYEVLSEKSSMKMYYNLLDKIKAKQDSLAISTNKTDYETNKESTSIIPSLSLINELLSKCDNNLDEYRKKNDLTYSAK
ncbi:hypothetical protein M9Y10_004691 [Tritrichomonas musculus]|uniref:Uncharacterized protein n=2 Tax=Tritrichomonas musculus TaxID=1915356 RepID=A0ABR2JKK6_9EUKA